MSDIYEINSSSGNYKIEVGENLIEKVTSLYKEAIYIVDSKLVGRLQQSSCKLIIIEAIEENKALERSAEYIAQLRNLGASRDTHLVAVGGGIIQDITTFIASIYMRGLPWTYLPTTVLSMVDSCIGGKSSINVLGYKNLVGNFYPPKDIYIDLSFIKTLSDEMIVGGLFESAKICYAKEPIIFDSYLSLNLCSNVSIEGMRKVVGLSLATKKWFIEKDEFDQKERLLLNFGHTFGHALEASTNFEVHHGIGVGAGMLIACEYARLAELLNHQGKTAVDLLGGHIEKMLSKIDGSPLGAPEEVNLENALEKFEYDKKHTSRAYRMVVPQINGGLALISVPRDASEREKIKAAFVSGLNALKWDYH